MITVLSGAPGNGKTCETINHIKRKLAEGAPVYTCGIPELDLPVIRVSKQTILKWFESEGDKFMKHLLDNENPEVLKDNQLYEFDDEADTELLHFPAGSEIVVDEAHSLFGKLGTKIPKHILGLTIHRHAGLNFYFPTQSPKLLHDIVKVCTSLHFHIMKDWRGRRIIEYSSVQDNPEKDNVIKNANSSKSYTIDKTTFKHFKSASVHLNLKYSIPKKFIFAIIFLLFTIFAFYYGISHFNERFTKPNPDLTEPNKQRSTNQKNSLNNQSKKVTIEQTPVIHKYVSCIYKNNICTCYDDQFKTFTINKNSTDPKQACISTIGATIPAALY